MPAMLKGYFDRVWAPVTTYGAPWWITRLIASDPGRKVLMRALKPMCGRHVRSFFLAQYDVDRSTPLSSLYGCALSWREFDSLIC
jgi:NAD(P)H dehydrogenase (quinone)